MLFDAEAIQAMEKHAKEAYPNECCGVIVRCADGRDVVVRIRNMQDEMHARDPRSYPRTARTAYAGHPGDLKAALEFADRQGNALRAFYHSHPDHEAYFSAEDVAQATPFGEPSYPQALQVVISVYGSEIRTIKSFAWSSESATFEPVEKP